MGISVDNDNSSPLPERPICCRKLEIVPGNPELIVASKDPISIPSSKALVELIPKISFFLKFFSICLLLRYQLENAHSSNRFYLIVNLFIFLPWRGFV